MRKIRVAVLVLCVSLLVVPTVFAMGEMNPTMGISGDIETNTTFLADSNEVKDGDDFNANVWINGGRARITFHGLLEIDSGWFAAARADSMLGMNGIASIDDAWVQLGKNSFGVKVGRFEAQGTFGLGNDILIVTPRNIPGVFYGGRYEGNYARGRFSDGTNNIALDWTFDNSLFQLGTVIGGIFQDGPVLVTTTDPVTGVPIQTIRDIAFGVNAYGFRPVYKYNPGNWYITGAFDYLLYLPQEDKFEGEDYSGDNNASQSLMGGALDLGFTFGNAAIGVAVAYGMESGKTVDDKDRDEQSTLSSFLWFTIGMREADELGLGVGYTTRETEYKTLDLIRGEKDKGNLVETYVSYIQQLPVESMKIKYALAYSAISTDPFLGDSVDSSTFGARIRLNYDF